MKEVITRGKPEYNVEIIKTDKKRGLMQVSGTIEIPDGQTLNIFVTGCADSNFYITGDHFDVFIELEAYEDPVIDFSTKDYQFELRLKENETKGGQSALGFGLKRIFGSKNGLGNIFDKDQRGLMASTWNSISENEVYDIRYAYDKYLKSRPNLKLYDLTDEMKSFAYKPRISIIMPVYNTDQRWFDKCIESIKSQIYSDWELCIADANSTSEFIPQYLKWLQNNDARIKVAYNAGKGDVRACNAALAMATGEFVFKMAPTDVIRADAICLVVKTLNEHPDVDLIYSDEDQIDENDKTTYPDFKGGWAPELLYSGNYIGNLSAFRKSIVDEIGGYSINFEKAYEYDFVLRFTEKTDRVEHIPEVIYSKRIIGNYADYLEEERKNLAVAGVNALTMSISNRGIDARADYDVDTNMCVLNIKPLPENTKFTVLLYGGGKPSVKFPKNAQVMNINNVSCEEINKAYSSVNGEFVIIWDTGVHISSYEDFLIMAAWAAQPGVGMVGPKLYDSNVCYSAGLAFSYEKVRSNIGHGEFDTIGYKGKYHCMTDVSAVSSKCMVLSRKAFDSITPLDGKISSYTGVEMGLNLMSKGYRSISVAIQAQMKAPMRQPGNDTEIKYLQQKWGGDLVDKYYSDVFENDGTYKIKY
ncbi:MAG: glycosyltransferase [Firmicutes bacterium]|nr:glycosyltransferase [Bacillota bacterium]